MIKTDEVIYHVKTVMEYDWLMRYLKTKDIQLPVKIFHSEPDLGVLLKNGIVLINNYTFFQKSKNYNNDNLNHIEVSDLMKNEKKTEILDKLETMNEYLNNRLKKLKLEEDDDDEESQKIRKIVYTTEVYFE